MDISRNSNAKFQNVFQRKSKMERGIYLVPAQQTEVFKYREALHGLAAKLANLVFMLKGAYVENFAANGESGSAMRLSMLTNWQNSSGLSISGHKPIALGLCSRRPPIRGFHEDALIFCHLFMHLEKRTEDGSFCPESYQNSPLMLSTRFKYRARRIIFPFLGQPPNLGRMVRFARD